MKTVSSLPHLVWFKKDLRVSDHLPLLKASQAGPCFGLYVIENEWEKSAEYSSFHLQFLKQSLLCLEEQLNNLGVSLLITRGSMIPVLSHLKRLLGFKNIYSHQETGLDWTFQRDKKVGEWARENAVAWKEYQQFAVSRGRANRDLWNANRKLIIERPLYKKNLGQENLFVPRVEDFFKASQIDAPKEYALQKGGSLPAKKLLHSFLTARALNYSRDISSPGKAWNSCSRLSPHIAWGTLSMSEIHQALQAAKARPGQPNNYNKQKSLKAFESRLWWHCHFIQKLESEPAIEFENFNRGFDGMREPFFNATYFEAWKQGQTGYPMVDACMRALRKHGWINFRMRAMLVSFASYHLWLHWKKPAQHLAQFFTDFEPGIHYSQIQMQSGTTGINTIRIYSPVKQSKDQDPTGEFIKKFCPELKPVDSLYIHQPELMPPMIQQLSGVVIGRDYPHPIVDHETSYNQAKKTIYEWRQKKEVRLFSKQVYHRHGSRKNSFFPRQHRQAFGNFIHSKESG